MRNHNTQHIAWGPDGRLISSLGMSPVPARSPYQAGDWVRCHGYVGAMPGPQQWGWRGFVLGGFGATILRGLTDDGREWAENWGALLPDSKPCPTNGAWCVCCPHPQRFATASGGAS